MAINIADHPNKVVAHDMVLIAHSSVWQAKYLEVFAQNMLKIFKYLTCISYCSWLSTDMAGANSQTVVLIFPCLWTWIWKFNRKSDCVKWKSIWPWFIFLRKYCFIIVSASYKNVDNCLINNKSLTWQFVWMPNIWHVISSPLQFNIVLETHMTIDSRFCEKANEWETEQIDKEQSAITRSLFRYINKSQKDVNVSLLFSHRY